MKRGKPLTRKTPLKAGKPLKRTPPPPYREDPAGFARQALTEPVWPVRAEAARRVLKARKPMVQRSAKARQVAAERSSLRLTLLQERGAHCQACPVTPVGDRVNPRLWSDMHEVLTRARGGDPTDPGNILCLCRQCHQWVTEHEALARPLGLVRGRTAEEHRAATGLDLTGGMI